MLLFINIDNLACDLKTSVNLFSDGNFLFSVADDFAKLITELSDDLGKMSQ